MGEYFCRACKFLDDDVRFPFPLDGFGGGCVVHEILLFFCRLTRSNTIAKTAASAGIFTLS
jgi:hypothetical protein